MPVSGLVVTLGGCLARVDAALAALRADPRVTLGERVGPIQPIVVDTHDADEDRRAHKSLHDLEGILKIEIVFVGFDQDGSVQPETTGSSSISFPSSQVRGNSQSPIDFPEVASC